MSRDTTSQQFFEGKYRANPDPWDFASNAYEQSRYEATINALNHRRYARALEPGCSIGALTSRLALHCDQIEAFDISPTAVKQAQERCTQFSNVRIRQGALPEDVPKGTFDLIVLSEIGYYLEEKFLQEVGEKLIGQLAVNGTLIAAHWLGHSDDHILSGDTVHQVLASLAGISLAHSERHPGFRLDRWNRV